MSNESLWKNFEPIRDIPAILLLLSSQDDLNSQIMLHVNSIFHKIKKDHKLYKFASREFFHQNYFSTHCWRGFVIRATYLNPIKHYLSA